MKKQLMLAIGLTCLGQGVADTRLSTTSGVWYDPAYTGSGFNIAEFSNGLFAYFYGYKGGSNGDAQWLLTETGLPTPIVVGKTYEVNMREGFVGNGGSFTAKPTAMTDTSGTQYWGTMNLTFNSCDSGIASLSGLDGDMTHNIVKLAEISGLNCETINDNGAVNKSYFLTAGLAEEISTVSCSLSDGTTGECYKIVTKNSPSDVAMGPWCPENISDDDSKGGIWIESGEVYDVDGAFVKNLAAFYNDSTWQMYDVATGEIIRTTTYDDFKNAADPNVGETYKNYCVEGQAAWVEDLTETFYIPVTPKKADSITLFSTDGGVMTSVPSVRGLAFNGVRFDAPAPTSAILAAYTLAPFDDAGGHLNPYAGYHYHAATGKTKEIAQSDGHAPMIGYALDGYPIYANTDEDGIEATDLDEARGHYDDIRGYHYHADRAGNNNFIDGLSGVYALENVDGDTGDVGTTPPPIN